MHASVFLALSTSAEVHRAPVPDLRSEAVLAAVGFERGVYRRHQLLLPHFNGHQLFAGMYMHASTKHILITCQT